MSCPTGKTRYRDELGAKIALSSTRGREARNKRRAEHRYYHCQQCRGWHLTSMEVET